MPSAELPRSVAVLHRWWIGDEDIGESISPRAKVFPPSVDIANLLKALTAQFFAPLNRVLQATMNLIAWTPQVRGAGER
jgi:hypothetical protein